MTFKNSEYKFNIKKRIFDFPKRAFKLIENRRLNADK